MPFPGQSDGRDYSTLPRMLTDPVPLESAGKLYSKEDAGSVQLFFQSDTGVVYQLTPTSGSLPNPIPLTTVGSDPSPVLGTGYIYTKDVSGTAQLFYETDDGTVFQLTPISNVYPFEMPETTDPAAVPNTGFLYTKDESGATELFFRSDNGNITQLTPFATPPYPFVLPETTDPSVAPSTGFLYAKDVSGIAQLFYLADDGTISQLTPIAALTYPFELPETTDPAPVANQGLLYAKDVAGVTQLFYCASDGTITQLTPEVPEPYPFELPETTDPGAVANQGFLYSKDASGVTQLYYRASDGTISQLTPITPPTPPTPYPFELPETTDPVAVVNQGFLYSKDASGITQLYYRASDGTISQLTPVTPATPYPFTLPETTDPSAVANTGFLYSKDASGITQLYYRASDGTISQLTPVTPATPYPFQLPETTDPSPIANTGLLYTKDVAGITQLYYIDSAGTIYALTPLVVPGQIADFVYDTAGVQAGNVYTTFSAVVAAANALGAPCRVYVKTAGADSTRNSGTYDVSLIHFMAPKAASPTVVTFNGATLTGSTKLELSSVSFENSAAAPLIVTTSVSLLLILRGCASVKANSSSSYIVRITNQICIIEIYDEALLDISGGFAVLDASGALINTGYTLRTGHFINTNTSGVGVCSGNCFLNLFDWSCEPLTISVSTTQVLNSNSAVRKGVTPAQVAANLAAGTTGNWAPALLSSADILKVTPGAGGSTLTGLAIGTQRTIRLTIINGSATDTLTLNNQDLGSTALNRFITNTGAAIVVPVNGIAELLYDVSSSRWRAWIP